MSAEKNHEQRLTSSRLHDEILASSGEKRTARLRIPLGTILKLNEMHFLKQISSLTSSLSSSLLFNSLFSFSVLQVHQLRFQSFAMFVVNTPKKKLRFTNYAYCSLGDFRKFAIPRSSSAQVIVRDSVVLSLAIHNKIIDGQIALNFVQREHIEVSVGDQISVTPFFPPASFSLALLTLELEHDKGKAKRQVKLDATALAQHLHKKFSNQVMTTGQSVLFKFLGTEYIFSVNQAWVEEQETSDAIERGIATNDTYIVFVVASSSLIKIINQREAVSSILWQTGFNLQKFGIGGLGEEFAQIFRRAFASRLFPPHVINKLGIKHVKGMLLYGPPGTGKTLMARHIGKLLSGREPKIVSGPEVLNKYSGQTEKNVRDLFVHAEQEQRARGDQSDLHVIIFDEIFSLKLYTLTVVR